MIDQFVDICLRHRIAVIVIALLLGVFGIYAWETLTVEAMSGRLLMSPTPRMT